MSILHVASEVSPFSQSGGLAQVASALPAAQRQQGQDLYVLSPLYESTESLLEKRGLELTPLTSDLTVDFDGVLHRAGLYSLRLHEEGPVFLFVDYPDYYRRGGLYGDAHGSYGDNAERYALLCLAALEAVHRGHLPEPRVIHCHDWQTGLLPLLMQLRYPILAERVHTVFTIHNLAYQGVFHKSLMNRLDIPWSTFTMQGLEYEDQVNCLKAGVAYSDATTTVSPSYAEEIATPEFGCGLHDFLAYDCERLVGIRNGIDVEEWNPATDPAIPENYDADDMSGKALCRQDLLAEYQLPIRKGDLLLGVVSRMAEQKGLDLIADLVPELSALGARLIVLGNGERELEERFRWLAKCFSHHVSVHIGFDPDRAHRVFAGVDAFVMPSRFEPCGLGQMAAMRYGSVPIVHAVGGLKDTVVDPGDEAIAAGEGNGFRFEHATDSGLYWALERATKLHRRDHSTWTALARRGMRQDWSWSSSARAYLRLYRSLR